MTEQPAKHYEKGVPLSTFQQRFRINEDFYPADYIRTAVLECFPQNGTPFTGLDFICVGDENNQHESLARRLTQRTDMPRDTIVRQRIPNPESLSNNTEVAIVEAERYTIRIGGIVWQRKTTFAATDMGYVAIDFGETHIPEE